MGLLDGNGWIDSGSITFEGKEISNYKREEDWIKIRGKKIAMVFQDPMTSLNPLELYWQTGSRGSRITSGIGREMKPRRKP